MFIIHESRFRQTTECIPGNRVAVYSNAAHVFHTERGAMQNKIFSILVLPLISIALFFGGIELLLKIVDFKPSLTIEGDNIPFWARNAQSVINGIKCFSSSGKELSEDVNAYEDDLLLCYRLIPELNIHVKFYDLSGMKLLKSFPDWTIITDSHGHRVADRNFQSPIDESANAPNRIKIAAMGGSSFFGWGLKYEDIFLYQLELLMKQNHPGKKFVFTNHAAPGYALSQHLIILKKMIETGDIPDIILLDATSNSDVPVFLTDRQAETQRMSLPGKVRFLLERFRFFQAFEMVLLKTHTKQRATESKPLTPRIPLDDFSEYLMEFLCMARHHNIRLIMAGLCASKAYIDTMTSFAEKNSVDHIDFLDMIDTYPIENKNNSWMQSYVDHHIKIYGETLLDKDKSLNFLFPDRCHPNALGHKALALEMAKLLNEGVNPNTKQ